MLEFAEIRCPITVAVADMGVDVVIGIDFMKTYDVEISVSKNTMTVQGKAISLQCTGKTGCFRVVLTEKAVIPPGCEMIAQGRVIDSGIETIGLGIVEPTEKPSNLDRGVVARVLVEGKRDIPLRIANFSNTEQTLYPYTNVATISKVNKIEECQRGYFADHGLPNHLTDLYKRASEGMPMKQKRQVSSLLSKYATVFSESDHNLGRTGIIKYRIPTGDARPIKQPPRRVPVHMQEVVERQMDQMLSDGVIQPSSSPSASGIVLVRKKDGTRRFCVDYRRLNDVTIKDAYPLSRVDESLEQLAGSSWFSCLDISSGYWQVEVDREDKPKTAFTTRKGLFEFNVMPFGLCNPPATFERLIESVLTGLHWKICLIYLGNIIVTGKSFEDMISNLESVLKRFAEAGVKLKPRKCQLFKREVTFLGHVITRHGIKTDPEKTECIKLWPTPTNVTEVRSFLGLCSYY